ncbi:nucleotide exchange factor GrpE [Bacillus canaveralius]|uniref:Nucleotide exchange factor GrpE n=1 Tax=Bacillus canaveralius TaxID=1403243 RepID=A0A2N5GQU4_9BACI|nr:nucleotide exchange factor GrpE [Bacillus canaveralius]PLR86429.1 nucleotide exchange factor GrpE [Bacillus sp. V33-4]PLR94748.1 nucleotide exchange factor GrpE [Bacillus canaveralius]
MHVGWFWNKIRKSSPELEAIEQLSEQNSLLKEQCRLLGEQIAKLSRLQYKTSKDTQEKLDLLNESLDSVIKKQEAFDEQKQAQKDRDETKLQEAAQSLIHWLDDLDLVNSRLTGENQDSWKKLMEQWIEQLLALLTKLEIQELKVLGSSFDSRVAESIGTVSRTEAKTNNDRIVTSKANIPYQIVEVAKRGFISKSGTLLRKAQVITLEEENPNAES